MPMATSLKPKKMLKCHAKIMWTLNAVVQTNEKQKRIRKQFVSRERVIVGIEDIKVFRQISDLFLAIWTYSDVFRQKHNVFLAVYSFQSNRKRIIWTNAPQEIMFRPVFIHPHAWINIVISVISSQTDFRAYYGTIYVRERERIRGRG